MGSEDTLNPTLEETLDNFTDAQLNNELIRRRKVKLEEDRRVRLEMAAAWEGHLGNLIALSHHSSGCEGTDTHHPRASEDRPCLRCFLLRSKEMTWWDPDYRLDIIVEYAPIEED